ncbi:hypothetical protein [Litorivivens sp.]|uniref:hypothetical protein n=1 Tax=Litorivivens sp. TaxID=2020868 RepID=UPI003564D9B8
MNPFQMINEVCNQLVEDHLSSMEGGIKAKPMPCGQFQCAGRYKDAEFDFQRPTAAQAEEDANTFIEMVDQLEAARKP